MALAWVKKTERDHYDRTVGIRWKLMDGDREVAAVAASRTDHQSYGAFLWESMAIANGQLVPGEHIVFLIWPDVRKIIAGQKRMLMRRFG